MRNLKIGSSLWYGHRPFSKKFRELLEIGFDYFEISLDYPFPDECDELEKAVRDFGIQPAFHAPLDILLACPRDEIFRASMKVLERCLSFAAKFETLYFNFHALHFTPTFLFPEIRNKAVRNVEEACRFAVEFGKESGFEVCLENDRFFTEEFIRGDIKLTLDLGHFAVEETWWGRDYRDSLIGFVERYGDRILVTHVHDVSFNPIQDHLPLGSGDFNLQFLSWLLREKTRPKYVLLEIFWKGKRGSKVFANSKDLESSFEVLRSVVRCS
jgi:sugar phosphate isomerase/epimerase